VETGWKGLHAENGIVTTLFGLLFWDVLFSAQVDVFQTEFQSSVFFFFWRNKNIYYLFIFFIAAQSHRSI